MLSPRFFPVVAALSILTTIISPVMDVCGNEGETVIDIGSRRELFVDDFLIDRLSGDIEMRLHHPVAREVVLTLDEPWEGSGTYASS